MLSRRGEASSAFKETLECFSVRSATNFPTLFSFIIRKCEWVIRWERTQQRAEVKAWLAAQFDAAGKDVPDFEYTLRSIAHMYNLATVSQAKTQAAKIVANDFRQKAAEYRSQAARIREILDNVGLAQESLLSNVVASVLVLANVANLLNIRDTELKGKEGKVHKESKTFPEYTRKAIARLTYLKSSLVGWAATLALLNRVGYTPEINHGVLVEMAEHRKDLEKKTKPILDTLRSYQDLPPDKALNS
ncbi:hypothetical protein CRYUN_Cryun15aG0068400 [Craigia yunnanensis]